jgi:hypothetical protein
MTHWVQVLVPLVVLLGLSVSDRRQGSVRRRIHDRRTLQRHAIGRERRLPPQVPAERHRGLDPQFGTADYDAVYGMASDPKGVVTVGTTHGAFEGQTNAGDRDVFLVRIAFS